MLALTEDRHDKLVTYLSEGPLMAKPDYENSSQRVAMRLRPAMSRTCFTNNS